jgi:hypothetical protein
LYNSSSDSLTAGGSLECGQQGLLWPLVPVLQLVYCGLEVLGLLAAFCTHAVC